MISHFRVMLNLPLRILQCSCTKTHLPTTCPLKVLRPESVHFCMLVSSVLGVIGGGGKGKVCWLLPLETRGGAGIGELMPAPTPVAQISFCFTGNFPSACEYASWPETGRFGISHSIDLGCY